MDRRDFLLLRTGAGDTNELSCERFYMRYVDAAAEGTLDSLFAGLARDLEGVRTLRLVGPEWLEHEDLNARIGPILARFAAPAERRAVACERIRAAAASTQQR